MANQGQAIPVRVYESDEHIMVAAPMPGLEPEDISVTITGDHIEIRGAERGPSLGVRPNDLDNFF